MSESRDYLEMTYKSINCFADDGKLDVNDLNEIFSIAKRDGVVDDNERRVLGNIIKRITAAELTDEMQQRMEEIRQEVMI